MILFVTCNLNDDFKFLLEFLSIVVQLEYVHKHYGIEVPGNKVSTTK